MVDVAQLVESWIVIPVVVGSSPIVHPIFMYVIRGIRVTGGVNDFVALVWEGYRGAQFGPLAQLVEQLTLNQLVVGSSPTWPTRLNARPVPGFFLGIFRQMLVCRAGSALTIDSCDGICGSGHGGRIASHRGESSSRGDEHAGSDFQWGAP